LAGKTAWGSVPGQRKPRSLCRERGVLGGCDREWVSLRVAVCLSQSLCTYLVTAGGSSVWRSNPFLPTHHSSSSTVTATVSHHMTAAARTSVIARSWSVTRLRTIRSRLRWSVTISAAAIAAGAESIGSLFRRRRRRRTLVLRTVGSARTISVAHGAGAGAPLCEHGRCNQAKKEYKAEQNCYFFHGVLLYASH